MSEERRVPRRFNFNDEGPTKKNEQPPRVVEANVNVAPLPYAPQMRTTVEVVASRGWADVGYVESPMVFQSHRYLRVKRALRMTRIAYERMVEASTKGGRDVVDVLREAFGPGATNEITLSIDNLSGGAYVDITCECIEQVE